MPQHSLLQTWRACACRNVSAHDVCRLDAFSCLLSSMHMQQRICTWKPMRPHKHMYMCMNADSLMIVDMHIMRCGSRYEGMTHLLLHIHVRIHAQPYKHTCVHAHVCRDLHTHTHTHTHKSLQACDTRAVIQTQQELDGCMHGVTHTHTQESAGM